MNLSAAATITKCDLPPQWPAAAGCTRTLWHRREDTATNIAYHAPTLCYVQSKQSRILSARTAIELSPG